MPISILLTKWQHSRKWGFYHSLWLNGQFLSFVFKSWLPITYMTCYIDEAFQNFLLDFSMTSPDSTPRSLLYLSSCLAFFAVMWKYKLNKLFPSKVSLVLEFYHSNSKPKTPCLLLLPFSGLVYAAVFVKDCFRTDFLVFWLLRIFFNVLWVIPTGAVTNICLLRLAFPVP